MSAQANEAVARRIIEEGFSQGNVDVVDEVSSPEWVSHDPADEADIVGAEAHKQRMLGYRTAMSDLQVTVEDCFGAGDKVCIRWRARGTNDGPLGEMPATGNSVDITGNSIDHFDADGKIVETWDNWDNAGFMAQLGTGAEAMAEAG